MKVVIGYDKGQPQYRDEGPARARVSGWGGSLASSLTVVKPPPKRLPRDPLNRPRWGPLCLKPLIRDGGPCHRSEGHGGAHASEGALDRLNMRRRLAL